MKKRILEPIKHTLSYLFLESGSIFRQFCGDTKIPQAICSFQTSFPATGEHGSSVAEIAQGCCSRADFRAYADLLEQNLWQDLGGSMIFKFSGS